MCAEEMARRNVVVVKPVHPVAMWKITGIGNGNTKLFIKYSYIA